MNIAQLVTIAATLVGTFASHAGAEYQNARKSPEWLTRGVIYQIQPRAFTPEGTLKAASAKLPYVKDLGATIVYLVPVMKMDTDTDRRFWSPHQISSGFNSPKNQYRISDYFHVDEEYGTDDDLKKFCAEAHRLGMKVMFDLVYFHCGPTAPFIKEHPEFVCHNEDGSVKNGPWRFPQLNFEEPRLREYLLCNVRWLILEFGADAFRCDVGDGVPLDFWCEMRDVVDKLTDGKGVILSEGYTVCNQQKAFDLDYGYLKHVNADYIRKNWENREGRSPRGARFMNHYEHHGAATNVRPRRETSLGPAAVEQVLRWMFTLDGVPLLFSGNEIADADPKHSLFGKTPMDWLQLEREPGKSRHAFVKRLCELRRSHPVFTDLNGSDGLTWLDTSAPKSCTAFVRHNGKGDAVIVVQNWTAKPVSCTVSFKVLAKAMKRSADGFLAGDDLLAQDDTDRSIKATVEPKPLLVHDCTFNAPTSFNLGPWGCWVSELKKGR